MSSSVGILIPNMMGKTNKMFQTANQTTMVSSSKIRFIRPIGLPGCQMAWSPIAPKRPQKRPGNDCIGVLEFPPQKKVGMFYCISSVCLESLVLSCFIGDPVHGVAHIYR
jgi:hypothetical protein